MPLCGDRKDSSEHEDWTMGGIASTIGRGHHELTDRYDHQDRVESHPSSRISAKSKGVRRSTIPEQGRQRGDRERRRGTSDSMRSRIDQGGHYATLAAATLGCAKRSQTS